MWLEHLLHVCESWTVSHTDHTQDISIQETKSFSARLQKLKFLYPSEPHIGIEKNFPLDKILNDVPIDSFLLILYQDLTFFEKDFFEWLQNNILDNETFLNALNKASSLWGITIAQKYIQVHQFALDNKKRTLQLFSEIIKNILMGGELLGSPILIRLHTDFEYEHELLRCAHQMSYSQNGAKLYCAVESKMFEGFAYAFIPTIHYVRFFCTTYCTDKFKI